MLFLTQYEYSNVDNFPLKSIKISNETFPLAIGLIGTITNIFLIISYITRENKFINKYYYPICCLSNQINIFTFVAANILNSNNKSLINQLVYFCKIFSYINHISSCLLYWIFAIAPFIMRCHLSKLKMTLERTRVFLILLPIFFGIIYSFDLIYLDLIAVRIIAHNTSKIESTNFMCGIKDPVIVLTAHLLDLAIFYALPFIIMAYNLIRLKFPNKTLLKLKIMMLSVSM